jgi:membrane protein
LVEDLAASQTSMTTVGFVSLLLAAGGAFSALERGINIMLGTQKRRHFIGTRLLLAGMMLATAMGLFLWRIVTSMAPKIVNSLGVDFPEWLLYNPLTELGIQLGVTAAGFYVLIRVLATEKFSRLARWTGALVFALLFHVSRVGLDYYLTTTPLQQVYGTAMAFIGLILWLYVSSLLLLISSSVIHAVHVVRQPVKSDEHKEIPDENPSSDDPGPEPDSDIH